MSLRYATDVLGPITLVEEHLLDWQRCGLNYTASGYGHIPTTTRVRFGDARWRRLWSVGYSNSRSLYVRVRGERLYVAETDIPVGV